MKAWGIAVTILLIVSLCFNAWYFSETSKLNVDVRSELGYGTGSQYNSPLETMANLRSNFARVMTLSRELKSKYETLRTDYERVMALSQELKSKYETLGADYASLQQEMYRLEQENQQYEAQLLQIKREAERAERLGLISSLLSFIFSLF